jgi:hypothetical protein
MRARIGQSPARPLIEVQTLHAGNWTGIQCCDYKQRMTSRTLHVALLQQLFEFASAGRRTSVRALGERVGLGLGPTANALSALHDAGLVDATRLRLTLSGLAVAVATRALGCALPLAA